MRKNYQNVEIDTSRPAVPDSVSVALAELAGEMREGLLALAVGTGLQVMAALMEADVTAACGPKGRHDPERAATRHGHGGGSVTLGGRRVPVERPRMRAVDGSGELPVPATATDKSTTRHAQTARFSVSHVGSPAPSLVVLHPGAPQRHSQIFRRRSPA